MQLHHVSSVEIGEIPWLAILVTDLCDHGQPDQVGRYTHEGDEEFLPGTQEARPLVDAGRDEPLHRTKLNKRRNNVNSLRLKNSNSRSKGHKYAYQRKSTKPNRFLLKMHQSFTSYINLEPQNVLRRNTYK